MLFPLPRRGLPRVWEDSPRSLSWACKILFLGDVVLGVLGEGPGVSWKLSFSVSWKLSFSDGVSSKWIFSSAFVTIRLHDLHILDRGQDLHVMREHRLGFFGSFRS